MEQVKSLVVVAAHTGDYVWRCAGAIALHAKLGYRVSIICLSYGERGEASHLFRDPAMTQLRARDMRKKEAEKAAKVLGAEIHFFDGDDYILRTNEAMLDRAVAIMRELRVNFILTHTRDDPANMDHAVAARFALEARMSSQAVGRSGGKAIGAPETYGMTIGAPQVYSFEPHQSELSGFKPDTFLDISNVWDQKWEAIQCIESQPLMWQYYKNVAQQRGATAKGCPEYAEAFQRIFPSTVQRLG